MRLGACSSIAVVLLLAGCGKEAPHNVTRAFDSIEGGRIVVTGAHPQIPADAIVSSEGFFEEARWDEAIQTLQIKGWAPLDVRPDKIRFVLRDPFDQLRLEGTAPPIFTPQERPDVAAAFSHKPALLHSGFTASVRLTNLPKSEDWTETLELYCLDGAGSCFRLQPTVAPDRRSWDRSADHFEVVLMYAAPQLELPQDTQGSLDVCEPGPNEDTAHLTGWAPFDGRNPQCVLIVQLAPDLAPSSLLTASWLPRPDVRAAVDPQREELDRCGFGFFLRVPGGLDALYERGAVHLFAIDAAGHAVQVGLPVLRNR